MRTALRVLVAPDKFAGTLSAREVGEACASAVRRHGGIARTMPLADGGDGTLEAFGGANEISVVTGPLGGTIDAPWRMDGTRAVIEMARASGLALVGGAAGNDPLAASTRGTGELIVAALDAGATEVIVGLGGSASTDGGLGALEVLANRAPFGVGGSARVDVACDVRTRYVDAAEVFGPQKGADAAQIAFLRERLVDAAATLEARFGVDVRELPRSGAAGGLAGGLASLGARLCDGFSIVADECGFSRALCDADLVVTGEGRLDATSLEGKVVGGVFERCRALAVPLVVIAGSIEVSLEGVHAVSLVELFGELAALFDAASCVEEALVRVLSSR